MTEIIDSENNINDKFDFFLNKEKKYLELLYIQIMRNSKSDKFNKVCLINFLSLSEYLNSKIFSVISKEDEEDLKIEEFSSGISLIFSLYLPINGEKLVTAIFNMISDNSESTNYKSIRAFVNNLIFDCMCKISKYDFEFFISLAFYFSDLIKRTFSIGLSNTKLTQFTKRDFYNITQKSPVLVNLVILMLNMLSPINEKLILKFIEQDNFEIYENDDFEEEIEFKEEIEEKTPRINSLPSSGNLFDLEFSRNYFDSSVPNSNSNINNNNSSNCFSNYFLNENSLFLNKSSNSIYYKNDSVSRKDSNSSIEILANCLDKINNSNYNEAIFKKNNDKLCDGFFNGFNKRMIDKPKKNRFSKFKKFDEGSPNETSTDNSDLFIGKNESRSLNLNNINNKNFSPIKDGKYKLNNNSNNSDKLVYSFNSKKNNNEKKEDIKSDNSFDENLNRTMIVNNIERFHVSFINNQKEKYDILSNNNNFSFQKDLSLINISHCGEELHIFFSALYNEVKCSSFKSNPKFKALLRKKTNMKNATDKNQNNKKFINLNEDMEERIIPFKIKFISDDLVIYNSNPSNFHKNMNNETSKIHRQMESLLLKKSNNIESAKYSVYFYKMKNLILSSYPNKSECEVEVTLEGYNCKYFLLEFYNIDQPYEFLFEKFQELEDFYKTIYKRLRSFERLFFLNTKKKENYHLVQRLEVFQQEQKRFSTLHELVDSKNNKSLKLQTLNKRLLKTYNFLFLKRLFDTCRLNNFLDKNVFPIDNIYNNHIFVILEYSCDDYKIKYEKEKRNYSVMVKNIVNSHNLKGEVMKFKKIVKLLNNFDDIADLFHLFEAEKVLFNTNY